MSWSRTCTRSPCASETKITAEVIAAAPKLQVVGRAGVGVDNVDVEAATERGVIVMNTPSGNTIATAELTFTHMLCGARPVPQAAASMRAGKWDRKSFSGLELLQQDARRRRPRPHRRRGRPARPGLRHARRSRSIPYLAPEPRQGHAGRGRSTSRRCCAQSDYITVHMPLTDDTRNLIDEAALAKTRKGVRLFNCARGGIIKEAALVAALKSGHVAAAGLDVYEDEPLAAGQRAAARFPTSPSRRTSAPRPPRRRTPSASRSPSRSPTS